MRRLRIFLGDREIFGYLDKRDMVGGCWGEWFLFCKLVVFVWELGEVFVRYVDCLKLLNYSF